MESSAGAPWKNPKGDLLRHLRSYGLAIAAVSAGFAARYALSIAVGQGLPIFLFFYPTVILLAFFAGMGPGFLATALAAVAAVFLMFQSEVHPASATAAEVVGLALFCIMGTLVSIFAQLYSRARQKALSYQQTLSLQESEDRFSTIFHSSPISMSIARMSDGQLRDVNQAYLSLFGYAREEAIGRTSPEMDMWIAHDDIDRAFGMLNRQGSARNVEVGLRKKSGEELTVLVTAEVIKLGNERLIWSSYNDITERKLSEEALRLSETRFSLAFANNPAAITLTRLEDGLFLDVNDTWLRLTGYSREEAIGHPARSMGIWPNPEDAQRFVRELKEKGSFRGWEQKFYKKSGEPFVAQLAAQLMAIHGDNVILSTLIDITQRKEAEIALRTLVDAVPESVVLTDAKGVALAANETFARRFGKLAEELIGTQLYDLFPSDIAEVRKRYAEEIIQTGEPRRFEDLRDGRYLDNRIHPIKDSEGQVTRLAILSLDVTDQKQAENKLKEQAALLDIASDAILAKELDGRIVYWNKGAERLYGWSADEVKGRKTFELLYTEEHLAAGQEALREVTEKGEWTRRASSKDERWQETNRRGALDSDSGRQGRAEGSTFGKERRHRQAFDRSATPAVPAA